MARIENYGNDALVTLDDKVIGTDAVDNSTKNFTVGDIVALASSGTTYTAGTGISITNGVISSTIVDTDTNNYISNVALNGTSLDFTGTAPAFNGSIPLGAIADQTVTIAGTNGITVTGTYPNFSISGAGIGGSYDWSLFADTGDLDPVTAGTPITFAGGTNVTTSFANNTLTINATGISGTGVLNNVPKWTGPFTQGASLIIDDGNGVAIGIQPPAARFHVHNGSVSNSILKLTHTTQAGVQDGMDITLSSIAGQIWLYEPNIPLRFATNNAERFSIDGAGQGWFKYGLRISAGIVDSNTTKGTAGQILSSTGTEVEWVNAPSAGSTTLNGLTDTALTNVSTGDYLKYNGTAWANTPGAYPERLILRALAIQVPTNGVDLLFASVGGNVKSNSVHIEPAKLTDIQGGFEVINDCVARIAIGAYVDRLGHAGEILFKIEETGSGTVVGQASFPISNQATVAEAFSFFSFFQLLAGETYIFSVQAVGSNPFAIDPGTFIEIEVIK